MVAILSMGVKLTVGGVIGAHCYRVQHMKHSWGKWSFLPVIDFKQFFREPSNDVDNTNG